MDNLEPVDSILSRAKHKLLHEVPATEWPSVYDNLNSWNWDDRLGEEPIDWGTMEEYKPPKRFLCFRKKDINARTKDNVVWPIMQVIERLIGEKAILRYHHVHNLGRTDQQFEDWWDSKSIRKE